MLPGSGFQFCRRRRSTVFVERYTKQKCRLQKRQVKFLTSTKQFHISGNYECLGMSGYKFPDEQHRQNFENTKHVPFLFQKFTPFNFGDFCWPTRKLPSDIGCGFLHSCGHLRKCLRRVSRSSTSLWNFWGSCTAIASNQPDHQVQERGLGVICWDSHVTRC